MHIIARNPSSLVVLPARLIAGGLVLAWGVALTLLAVPLAFSAGMHRRAIAWISRHWFRNLRRVFGVRLVEVGEPAAGPVLVAANHVSWMDIVLLGEKIGACFVSKSEVADWPVMGWLARQGGTLFIQRGHRDSAERIAHAMAEELAAGRRLLFFPEGTTSDGWQVLKFRPRLFVPAVQTATPVQPVAICYGLEAGSDPIAYIDGISFVRSILGVMSRWRNEVTVYWGESFETRGLDKRDVAARAGNEVAGMMARHRAEDRAA